MRITIRFEDTHGLFSLYNYTHKCIDNRITLINKLNSNTYSGIEGSRILSRETDYIIALFDMDSPDVTKYDFLTWDYLITKFGSTTGIIKGQNFQVARAYIRDEDRSNHTDEYVGDKIVLMPVFFCFESLYLLDKALYNIWTKLPTTNPFTSSSTDPALNTDIAEVILNYPTYKQTKIQGISKEKQHRKYSKPQEIYQYCASELLKELVKGFNEKIPNIDSICSKKEEKLFKAFEKEPLVYNVNELMSSILNNSIFNYELGRIYNAQSVEELASVVQNYTFNNYQHTLKFKMELYKDILENDFKDAETLNKLVQLCRIIGRKQDFIDKIINSVQYYRSLKGY